MLSAAVSLNIPGVSAAMDRLDSFKAKFLAVPANVRLALDKLARIQVAVTKTAPETVEFHTASLTVKNNLTMTQTQWSLAAERFAQLDALRKDQASVSMDTITLASQLLTSVASVVKNADTNVAAVDRLAERYLTAEQRSQLQLETVGTPSGGGFGIGALVAAGALAYMFFRRR